MKRKAEGGMQKAEGGRRKAEGRRQKAEGGKERGLRWLLLGVVVLTAREYAHWTFDNLSRAQMIVMGLEERPYVYRALVPWLAHLLVMLGLRADVALTVLVILSAVGLVYGIQYLLKSFRH